MRVSLRWLSQYLQTDLKPGELLDAITTAGHEVEETIDLGALSGNLVVGEILKIEKVPDADKIQLVEVMADGKSPLSIVCGASNIRVGQRVPVAKFGMRFPNGDVLKPRKIRGLESQGMLCSAKELGVAEDAAGIWILAEDTPLAEPVDLLATIKVTPNRPDILSLIGLARDLAAKSGGKLRVPAVKVAESANRVDALARVSVEAREDCPRYAARVIENVTVGPSPRWMQAALEAAGLRPINNIVDVTNYVLLEMGHPLHAFDLEKVSGRHVVVRLAKPGETIELLDGKTVELQPTDLCICDASRPIALAGIMGGANSEIAEGTRTVLLESAYFRPQTIRKTARRLDKKTDASYRFERGTDAHRLTVAMNRAAQLIAELSGGTVAKGHIDVAGRLPDLPRVNLRLARVKELLGYSLSGREVADIFTALGFEVLRGDRDEIQVEVPSHRVDVAIEEDLIEEIARIVGYGRIPEELPAALTGIRAADPLEQAMAAVREAAVAAGLCETINFSFVSEGANAMMGLGDSAQVRLKNPIEKERPVLRRSLVPTLLENLVENLNQGVEDVRLFELGRTYAWPAGRTADEVADPRDMEPAATEVPVLGVLLAGGGKRSWREPASEYAFHDIKGIAETMLEALSVSRFVVDTLAGEGVYHPGRSATILVKGQPAATLGELHPAILRELGIKKRVYALELPLTGALLEQRASRRFSELPRFPASTRDLAVVVPKAARALDIERTIRKAGKELLASVSVFDVYEGPQVGDDKRSVAFSLVFRSPERTLQDAEVAAAMDAIMAAVKDQHGATVRS